MAFGKKVSLGVIVLLILAVPGLVHVHSAEPADGVWVQIGGGSSATASSEGALGSTQGDPDEYVFYYGIGNPDSLIIERLDPLCGVSDQQTSAFSALSALQKTFELFVFVIL